MRDSGSFNKPNQGQKVTTPGHEQFRQNSNTYTVVYLLLFLVFGVGGMLFLLYVVEHLLAFV